MVKELQATSFKLQVRNLQAESFGLANKLFKNEKLKQPTQNT
jgi:hypothetical protein